jgi:hypothetical protein
MLDYAKLREHLTAAEKAELDQLLAIDAKRVWRPLPGPQTQAYYSKADVLGYGGAAGGGKTDLACGLALTNHARTLIVRREATQLQGIYDRLAELLGTRDGFNSQDKIWRLKSRQIEFGSTPNMGDESKYQGRAHDLKVFDEATGQLEAQVRYIMGWTRTSDVNQRTRVLLTFNPPTTTEGRWVIPFFAPWLDDKHPMPAKPGELRWFATVSGSDMELEDGRPFIMDGKKREYVFSEKDHKPEEIIRPQTRTFVPSRVSDNPHYMRSGYVATLQALPEPLRSQMLNGDFLAGVEDDPWQVIPTLWVDQAMARWEKREVQKGPMDSMGVDVARGGRDETIIARRHGTWFDELLCQPGVSTPDGPTLLAHVLAGRRDQAPVHIDIVGWGASPYDFLVQNRIQTVGLNGASKSNQMTAESTLSFMNLRAEMWWRMREALDPKTNHPIMLPPDNKLRADLCAPLWRLRPGGILIESKEDVIKRIGRSPDRGDAVCYALIATLKQGELGGRVRRSNGRSSPWAA